MDVFSFCLFFCIPGHLSHMMPMTCLCVFILLMLAELLSYLMLIVLIIMSVELLG